MEELEKHWADIDDKAAKLAATLRPLNVHRVVFDITALGAKVARLLGVPSVALSNFTFDWVYEAERGRVPALGKFIDLMLASYMTTAIWLALPFTAVRRTFRGADPNHAALRPTCTHLTAFRALTCRLCRAGRPSRGRRC